MLTWKQKTRIVELWNETKSPVTVRRRFIREVGLTSREKLSAPSNKTIYGIVKHFQEFGTVHPQRKGKSGNARTVRTRINACANRQGRHIEHVNYHAIA